MHGARDKLAIICFGVDYAMTIAIFVVKLASLYRLRSAVVDLWKYLSVFIDDYVYGGSGAADGGRVDAL